MVNNSVSCKTFYKFKNSHRKAFIISDPLALGLLLNSPAISTARVAMVFMEAVAILFCLNLQSNKGIMKRMRILVPREL